ncbi:MAG: response regulator [Gammaproteobacteria bacterium]|nr:response regulator [Gammaproteobacteria bacterium]
MQKVFIVDDHGPVLRVLRLGLEQAGYEVSSANNGSECLVQLCDQQPDFLVTDIDMPRMGGKELCFAIEKQFPERSFPIIVLTSRSELEHRSWTREIDNLGFMEKPVSVKRLIATIGATLSNDSRKCGT